MFFEGSEKKVEMVFSSETVNLRQLGLRFWERVVAQAKATILSKISDRDCTAFLLSESSLFVYDHSLIMITCGTTSLSDAIEEIFKTLPSDKVQMLVYERKNEFQPDDQPSSFDDDIAVISRYCPGTSHTFNGVDGTHIRVFHYTQNFIPKKEDMTLQLLMHDLGEQARGHFSNPDLAKDELYRRTGIQAIFPAFQVDDFLFDPMGYSLNAIGAGEYYTFHITPQRKCSYASFETNHTFSGDLQKTIEKVLAIFEPASFSLVFYEQPGLTLDTPPRYQHHAKEIHSFCEYRVHFYDFDRLPVNKTS